jgi:hypothetical protein
MVGDMRGGGMYTGFLGPESEGKRPSGRSRRRWVCMGPVETELKRLLWGLGWIELAQVDFSGWLL